MTRARLQALKPPAGRALKRGSNTAGPSPRRGARLSLQPPPNVPDHFIVEIRLTIVGKLTPVGYYDLTVSAQSASVDGRATPIVAFLRTTAFHPKFMPISLGFEGHLSALTIRK